MLVGRYFEGEGDLLSRAFGWFLREWFEEKRGEFSQRRLAGEEAFRYDYHSFTSLANI